MLKTSRLVLGLLWFAFTISAQANVPVPAKMLELISDLQVSGTPAAFRTPSGKTVAVAFYSQDRSNRQGLFAARFTGEVLDQTYGVRGSQYFLLRSPVAPINEPVFQQIGKIMVLAGNAMNYENSYLFLMQFSTEGVFNENAYESGYGYARIPGTCNRQPLTIRQTGNDIVVSATSCERKFGLTKPNLVHLKKPTPATCTSYQYETYGALDGQVYKLEPINCSGLSFSYTNLNTNFDESFVFKTDGECFDSKLYGRSCFYYENDVLTRKYIDRAWQVSQTWYAIVDAKGTLCSYHGPTGKYLITNNVPPTDPNFTRTCSMH